MENKISEQNLVPIIRNYDVIVIGGGIAGVSAALSAKRNGAQVLLVEKGVYLGGLATLGLIVYYEPLCDGKGKKIMTGIAEELLWASIKYGFNTLPNEWKSNPIGRLNTSKRYQTHFSAPAFVLALDEIIDKWGIDILYDTVFSTSIMENGRCKGIIVESKSGRIAYTAKTFVDTTGDLDVMFRSGAPCVSSDNWLTYSYLYCNIDSIKESANSGKPEQAIKWGTLGLNRLGEGKHKDKLRKYLGAQVDEITAIVRDGRRLLRDHIRAEGSENTILTSLPSMPQVRTTRRLDGCYELTQADVGRHFTDSVGCMVDYTQPGPVYEIPYRTLITEQIQNIITAGRSISSSGHAWELTRVIPTAAITGQAAGTAAAIAAREGLKFTEIPIDRLQRLLVKDGVTIRYK